MHVIFEVSSFNRSRDMKGSQNSKIKLRDPFMTPFDLILHFVDDVSFNLSVKFDANIFFTDRYMPILLFR